MTSLFRFPDSESAEQYRKWLSKKDETQESGRPLEAAQTRYAELLLECTRICSRCAKGDSPTETTPTPFGRWFHAAKKPDDVHTMDLCPAGSQRDEMKLLAAEIGPRG